jgi:hypothetical protein
LAIAHATWSQKPPARRISGLRHWLGNVGFTCFFQDGVAAKFHAESCKTRPVAHQDDAGFKQIGRKNLLSSLVCLAFTTPPDLLNSEIATIVSNANTEACGEGRPGRG